MKLKAELEGKPERAFETEKETKQDVENTVEEEVAITE
jgi:hypothetical protein